MSKQGDEHICNSDLIVSQRCFLATGSSPAGRGGGAHERMERGGELPSDRLMAERGAEREEEEEEAAEPLRG